MLVSAEFLRYALVPIVLLWVLHMAQRRQAAGPGSKRRATLYLTVVLIALWIAAWFFARFSLPALLLIPVAALAAAIVVWQRKAFFPYRRTCTGCGKRLSAKSILLSESNLCETCGAGKDPTAGELPGNRPGDRP